MIDQAEKTLILQAWFSPSFPIGSFSYSHGLEAAVQAGFVTDTASLKHWLHNLIEFGSCRNDVIFLKAAYQGDNSVNDLCLALCAGSERCVELVEMGGAFTKAVKSAYHIELPENLGLPVAIGYAAAKLQLDQQQTELFYVNSFISNLISIAIRIIPIGQEAGQQCLVELFPVISGLMQKLENATLNDIGSAAFLSDIMSMKHEQSSPRLLRT